MTERKYYEAFDERFRRVHQEGQLWFPVGPAAELVRWADEKKIPAGAGIIDIGCGEGQNAFYLAERGYQVTGVDISPAAIEKCRTLAAEKKLPINWLVADLLAPPEALKNSFAYAVAIGTLHILVNDVDRNIFLKSLFEILKPGGQCLMINMGDGATEYREDPEQAFEEQERLHLKKNGQIIKRVFLPQTTCRTVTWTDHLKEFSGAGFLVEKNFVSENKPFGKCMISYLKLPRPEK